MWRLLPIWFAFQAFAQPGDFFAHPTDLCSALEGNGIHAGPWQQPKGYPGDVPAHTPYFCEYSAPVADVDLNIIYRVSGDTSKRADIVTIAVTVYHPSALSLGKQELERRIAQLFKSLNRQEPAGLVPSIERQRYFLSRQAYGIVWFNLMPRDRQKIEEQTLWFRLQQ